MQEKEFFHIGRIVRTHGLDGLLIIKLSDDVLMPQCPKYLMLSIRNQLVPYFVSQWEPATRNTWLIKFDYIDSIDSAETLCSCDVFAQKNDIHEKESISGTISDLIGYKVIDMVSGEIGLISGFILNSPQPVMEIELGEKLILIPAVEPIIQKIDERQKTVYIDAPKGLIEMYLHE